MKRVREELLEVFGEDVSLVYAGLLGSLLYELESHADTERLWRMFQITADCGTKERFTEFLLELAIAGVKARLDFSFMAYVDRSKVKENLYAIALGYALARKEAEDEAHSG